MIITCRMAGPAFVLGRACREVGEGSLRRGCAGAAPVALARRETRALLDKRAGLF